MADASFVQTTFSGGERSKFAQGRTDLPDYRTGLNVCLNGLPTETGTWTRRPGTQHGGPTRGGAAGKLIKFDLQQNAPYNMEFTADYLRLWNGVDLVTGNDDQAIVSISTANPAKIETTVHGWSTGNSVFFKNLGANNPLLQNRRFKITVTSTTEFTIVDEITGATIDGATLGTFVSGTVARVLEFATAYTETNWSDLRSVQAQQMAFLLKTATKPYVLESVTAPTDTAFATFSLAPAVFLDGPYLDPFPGSYVTPSAKFGVIGITLSFQAYDATKAYGIGDRASYSAISYESLLDENVGNQPDISPTKWKVINANIVVGPNGFQASDLGRHVRLFSEPDLYAAATAYSIGNVVTWNNTYYKCIQAGTGKQPDLNVAYWLPASGSEYARWTWGKITSAQVSTPIAYNLAGSVVIGNLTDKANAFDNNPSQSSASAARNYGTWFYIGKDFSGASDKQIGAAIVYPATDVGLGTGVPYTLELRGSATAPVSSSSGTLLGSSGLIDQTTSPITINNTVDQATAWKYVWISALPGFLDGFGGASFYTSEVTFYTPSTETTNGCSVAIFGDPLLYTSAIRTWRLGLFSDTTGWPACGTYHEGRIWLSGLVKNRIDGAKPNDNLNGTLDFAPTEIDGTVSPNNAISYTFNAPDVNTIFWMVPDEKGIICGTQAGEWLVQATAQNQPLTPTSIQAHRVTKNGCANIEPHHTGLTIAFVQRYGRKVLEYFADIFSGRMSAPNLTAKSKHLTKTGLREIAYQQELAPVLWGRRDDGALVGWTYKRENLSSSQEPTFCGGHRHTLGSGRVVESICVGPDTTGTLDSLSMVTNDTTSNVRHVEIMTNLLEEGEPLTSAWYLDDAVTPSSTTTTDTPSADAPYGGLTINGLWHLNGTTVAVTAASTTLLLDCGDYAVTQGSITVPYGDSVSAGTGRGLFTASFAATATIVVGFTYTSDGQIVRPAVAIEAGTRTGPAFGKKRRSDQFVINVENSAGMSIGTEFSTGKMKPILFKTDSGRMPAAGVTSTGIFRDNLVDSDSFEGGLAWRITRPYPSNIIQIGPMLETKDV